VLSAKSPEAYASFYSVHSEPFDRLKVRLVELHSALCYNQSQLEYGYRLKEFNDEPITVAVRPTASTANLIQSTIASVKDRFSALLKRS
jgi:hypothetical protein